MTLKMRLSVVIDMIFEGGKTYSFLRLETGDRRQEIGDRR
jgi:hypothetical protein